MTWYDAGPMAVTGSEATRDDPAVVAGLLAVGEALTAGATVAAGETVAVWTVL